MGLGVTLFLLAACQPSPTAAPASATPAAALASAAPSPSVAGSPVGVAASPVAASSPSPAASAAPVIGSPSGNTPITIANAGANLIESDAQLALQDGDYAQFGLNASIVHISGSTNTLAALQSGDVQLAETTGEAVMLGESQGLPLLAVAPLNEGATQSLIFSNQFLANHPLPPNATPQQAIALLPQATVSNISATDAINYQFLLDYAGLPRQTLNALKMPDEPTAVETMGQGKLDALLTSAPDSYGAVEMGSGQIVMDMRDIPSQASIPYLVAVTTQSYAQQHPDILRGAVAALQIANAKMAAGGPDVLAFEKTVYPNYDEHVIQQSLDLVHMAAYEPLTQDQWASYGQLLLSSGELTQPFVPQEGRDWSNEFMPPKPAS